MIVQTGGSSVYKGKWSACDKPLVDERGDFTNEQLVINELAGIYLLAKGLVNRNFGYIRIKNRQIDFLVIQSKSFYNSPISDTKMTTSLFKYLAEHNDPIIITSPYPSDVGREEQIRRLSKIRQNIAIYHSINKLESQLTYPFGSGFSLDTVEYPFILQPAVYNKLQFKLAQRGNYDNNTEKD
jgi:hypothetical protein